MRRMSSDAQNTIRRKKILNKMDSIYTIASRTPPRPSSSPKTLDTQLLLPVTEGSTLPTLSMETTSPIKTIETNPIVSMVLYVPPSVSDLPVPSSTSDDEEDDDDDDSSSNQVVAQSQYSIPSKVNYHFVVYADFCDGYALRQQFEFFRQTITVAPMFFGPNGISITRGNCDDTLVTSTMINGRDLVDYRVDESKFNFVKGGVHVVNINLPEFHGHLKALAKQESLRIFQYVEEPGIVRYQSYGGKKNSDGSVHIKTEPFAYIEYKNEEANLSTDLPNVKVPLGAFCNACGNVARSKYPHAIIKCYPRGAHIQSGNETGSSVSNAHWGDCSGEPLKKSRLQIRGQVPICYTTKVPLNVIKGLTKMANFSNNGIVSIFCTSDGLVRLETSLGGFGRSTTYLWEKAQ